ncbi:MAG: sugar kinase [Acetobacteraceae bacterium]|nr:sugar kinase [Acetobacteraceae bacterium]
MTGTVACLGECMMELVARPGGTLTRGFGGDTLNTAVYLARLGVPTAYVSALGDDTFSDEMIASWQAEGIQTDGVLRVPGRLPGLYMIQTDDTGERRFFYWRDSAPVRQVFALPETPLVEAALLAADTIYLSGISLSLFGDAGRERLFALLGRARSGGTRVVFDGNFRPRGWPDLPLARAVYDRIYACSDIVLASVEDDMLLYGESDADILLSRLRAARVPESVVKLAHPACHVVHAAEAVLVSAEPVSDVVDTTAAGDSFAAAYVAARRAGLSPEASARAGHRLAGAVVRHRGAIIPRDAMPATLFTPEAAP